MRHQDKPLEYQIAGKWVRVDPSSWRKRTRVSANVGLGSEQPRRDAHATSSCSPEASGRAGQAEKAGLSGAKDQIYESFKAHIANP